MPGADEVQQFISRWTDAKPSERANSQLFLSELCDVLHVSRPDPKPDSGYAFEHVVIEQHADGSTSQGRIDLYKRGCFVLESKQFQEAKAEASQLELAAVDAGVVTKKKSSQPFRGTDAWDDAMVKARGQAERYVRALPNDNPPFLFVVDVGHTFELFADFTQAGKAYLPFPDPRTFRIRLKDLADESIRERLRLVWTDPAALDPAKRSADVTREVSGHLAELAKSLEQAGHEPDIVAQFLTRCLFCMFAEDVELLPERSFTELLDSLPASGEGFVEVMQQLFLEMDTGTGKAVSVVLRKKLLQFNGGLFADHTVLPLDRLQLGLLKAAARSNWRNVEPAIFGTLLERALNPKERHKLGAHFTPRAYVERLVLPTVVEPLRAQWENIRAAAITHARAGDLKKARAAVNGFHEELCNLKVLDPACGTGNFLYVALQQLKVLEGEVLDVAAQFGEHFKLELATHTIDPHQFLGIELNPRAAAIAELVLWIGYLQWHFKLHGKRTPPEPILRAFKNIECRDAVLAYDGEPQPARDEAGKIITVWDRQNLKVDKVTGRAVPDETKRRSLLTYTNPQPADWPAADFIVGNPPYIGTALMRADLGDGYAEALRAAYPEVPESANFVMYWWHKSAELVRTGRTKAFGLITTSVIRQTLNRRVVHAQLNATPPLSLKFTIPDHPWVDTTDGAAVRIAMTVGVAGEHSGTLLEVTDEQPQGDGLDKVRFASLEGKIQADLTVGARIADAISLKSNEGVAVKGFELGSQGFLTSKEDAEAILKTHPNYRTILKPYMNGDDLKSGICWRYVIDFFGIADDELRAFPELLQKVIDQVRPERSVNRESRTASKWWLFRRSGESLRNSLHGLSRFIGTTRTAKFRVFQFLPNNLIAESKIVVIASDDAYVLGLLSSRIHVIFATGAGGWHGVGNDPTYNHLDCFDKFPFPICSDTSKDRIRKLAEEMDTIRKRVIAQHGLTITDLYNVLVKLRSGETFTAKEKVIHDKGLVSVLKQLHDDLDAAVFAAYGWEDLWEHHEEAESGSLHDFKTGETRHLDASPEGFNAAIAAFERELDGEILQRLVALNAQRAAEEKRGIIHWLRPEYQAKTAAPQKQLALLESKASKAAKKRAAAKPTKAAWPASLAERVQAVEQALHQSGHPMTIEDLTQAFARAKPAAVAEILETLVTLGRARRKGNNFSR